MANNSYNNKIQLSDGTTIMDITDTTAIASDVAQGKYFYAATGEKTLGTASSGGSSNDFIVTLTKDQNDVWQPDKTYAEVYAAYSAGKTIAWLPDDGDSLACGYYKSNNSFDCFVYEYTDIEVGGHEVESYQMYNFVLSSTGVQPFGLEAEFYDTYNATAVPSDVANGKTFYNGDGLQTGTASGGGGSSSWTKVAETSYQVSTTSTSAATVATWTTGHSELWTKDKWVYVRIRDTAGLRNGYFFGSDQFFYNTSLANGLSPSYISTAIRTYTKYSGSTITPTATTGSTGYGVWADYLYPDGRIRIRRRYSSSTSLTIDGTFKVEVYLLDPAGGVPIFG